MSKLQRYIVVYSCDSITMVCIEMTDEEYSGVEKLAARVNAEGGGCKPRLVIGEEASLWITADRALEELYLECVDHYDELKQEGR